MQRRLAMTSVPFAAKQRNRWIFRVASIALFGVVVLGMRPMVTLPADMADAGVPLDVLTAEIERAAAAGDPITLDWKTLATLNYRTGEMPESLKKLNGQLVRVPGFMVPLEDWEQKVSEFILVPYFGACIHVPPPPPNQMAHVLMTKNQKVDVNLWDPVWVVGTLKIENVDSPYGVVGFQLSGEKIAPYQN
jgi:uncharacterized protein